MFGLRSDSRRPRFHPKRCSAVETRGSNRFLISEESDSSGYGDRSMISGNGGAVMICISGGSGRGLSRSHDPPRPSILGREDGMADSGAPPGPVGRPPQRPVRSRCIRVKRRAHRRPDLAARRPPAVGEEGRRATGEGSQLQFLHSRLLQS